MSVSLYQFAMIICTMCMESEIQLLLKRFPTFQCLFPNPQLDDSPERASGRQKLTPTDRWIDSSLLDGYWFTSGQVNTCKVSPKVVHPGSWGKRLTLT